MRRLFLSILFGAFLISGSAECSFRDDEAGKSPASETRALETPSLRVRRPLGFLLGIDHPDRGLTSLSAAYQVHPYFKAKLSAALPNSTTQHPVAAGAAFHAVVPHWPISPSAGLGAITLVGPGYLRLPSIRDSVYVSLALDLQLTSGVHACLGWNKSISNSHEGQAFFEMGYFFHP